MSSRSLIVVLIFKIIATSCLADALLSSDTLSTDSSLPLSDERRHRSVGLSSTRFNYEPTIRKSDAIRNRPDNPIVERSTPPVSRKKPVLTNHSPTIVSSGLSLAPTYTPTLRTAVNKPTLNGVPIGYSLTDALSNPLLNSPPAYLTMNLGGAKEPLNMVPSNRSMNIAQAHSTLNTIPPNPPLKLVTTSPSPNVVPVKSSPDMARNNLRLKAFRGRRSIFDTKLRTHELSGLSRDQQTFIHRPSSINPSIRHPASLHPTGVRRLRRSFLDYAAYPVRSNYYGEVKPELWDERDPTYSYTKLKKDLWDENDQMNSRSESANNRILGIVHHIRPERLRKSYPTVQLIEKITNKANNENSPSKSHPISSLIAGDELQKFLPFFNATLRSKLHEKRQKNLLNAHRTSHNSVTPTNVLASASERNPKLFFKFSDDLPSVAPLNGESGFKSPFNGYPVRQGNPSTPNQRTGFRKIEYFNQFNRNLVNKIGTDDTSESLAYTIREDRTKDSNKNNVLKQEASNSQDLDKAEPFEAEESDINEDIPSSLPSQKDTMSENDFDESVRSIEDASSNSESKQKIESENKTKVRNLNHADSETEKESKDERSNRWTDKYKEEEKIDRRKRWQYSDLLQLCIRTHCHRKVGVKFYNCVYEKCFVLASQAPATP